MKKNYIVSTTMLYSIITVAASTTMPILLLSLSLACVSNVAGFQAAAFQSKTLPSGFLLSNNNMHTRQHQKMSTMISSRTTRTATFQRKTASPTVSTSSSALQASPLTSWLATTSLPIGSIAVLAGIVVVHEMGHYLAAKSFGMTVEEFSIGFGPKLFGFQAPAFLVGENNKEEFNLRAFPLGGYVRFPENYNNTDYQVRKQQALATFQANKEEQARRQLENDLDLGSRVLNILTFGAVLQQKRQQELEQSTSASSSTLEKQSFWQVNNNNNANKEEEMAVLESVEIDYYDDPNLLQNRPWTERAVVLSAGVIFNLLLSFSIYFGTITFGAGLPSPVVAPGVVVVEIPLPNAAAQGVLKPGDVIVGMNGSPMMSLSTSSRTTGADASRAINKLIAQIRATPDGEDIQLQVLRNSAGKADLWKDNDDNYAQLLQQQQVISVKPQRTSTTSAQTIGVLLSPNLIENKVLQSNNPIEAAGMAAQYAATLTKETAIGLASFFGQLLTPFSGGGSSSSSVSQISGPIGLIKTGTAVIATNDIRNVLLFAAAISINLGVVNAFPLPALDGGQLVFVLAEAILSRKVDQRLQEGITGASLLFLLLISAGAAIGDIGSIFGF